MRVADLFRQMDYSARFEWGYEGVEHVGASSNMIVIVDVLSFTTCVDVVIGKEGVVFPYRMNDETARSFAREKQAILAGKRGEEISLSPASLANIPEKTRIVLPSPNGSTCTVLAKQCGAIVIAACLRNASAVARFIRDQGGTITVIASGERWPNGTMRPAIEDMIAAGAILDELTEHTLSPEAQMAVGAFRMAKAQLVELLQKCGSGQELIQRGYPEDVAIASMYNSSDAVPILNHEDAYQAALT
ncbi:2-phosphosulfolactate phosphatase [Brevibacillus nitrificans]|uniref:2-phosphosulfolactate phosphatase n=1 Tax=Brevibacillus nitrificans TaxID=651560 RepID=UPI002E1EB102|nr:2-phosphosulfolactate phosphatase [Brevibacillus nitrificans]